jgi:hypothetical protein
MLEVGVGANIDSGVAVAGITVGETRTVTVVSIVGSVMVVGEF